jgi:putative nucleotide binding protein
MEVAKEEYAIVLDFLPNGYSFDNRPSHRKMAIAQAIGKEHLTLLELIPKKDIFLQPYEEVYIGDGKREKIHHIAGALAFEKLTVSAKSELNFVIKEMVHKNPAQFIKFYNEAGPLSTRMHQLELIPGIGKKHMWELLEQRQIKKFESFEDIKGRVKLMPDPENGIIKRILLELEGVEKRMIFVR